MTETGLRDQDLDITVAVSCYNEESLITSTLDSVVGALTDVGCSYEIIVVDDVSRDNSVKRVPVEVLIPDAISPEPGAAAPVVGDKRTVEAACFGGDHA